MAACGLDFGTSNTTLGLAGPGEPGLVPLEGGDVTVPSAIFFSGDGAVAVGRAAVAAYVEGVPGRLMRGLKSVLGRPLLDEATQVGRERVRFREVIARYLATVKRRAEAAGGRDLDAVVHGRPVHFVDGDPAGDRRAEEALREIAQGLGFREVSFQFEPIAAALDYERRLEAEEIALIADIGGGTSDFSVVRLGPERRRRADREGDILANDGVRVGGTDVDRTLSLGSVMPLLGFRSPMKRAGLDVPTGYFHDLATWSSINRLYDPRTRREIEEVRRDAAQPALIERLLRVVASGRGHTLAMEVEAAKIALSRDTSATIALDWVEEGLAAAIDRPALRDQTGDLRRRIADCARACLRRASMRPEAIGTVVLTGGSTRLDDVRAAILATVPGARVVEGDIFGAVGAGLTLEARRRYGP